MNHNAHIIEGMPEEQYHAESGLGEGKWLTRSMIVDMVVDPASFHMKHIVKHPLMQFNGNEGTRFGSYVEAHILDRNTSMYVVKPTKCWSKSKKEIVDWNLRGSQMVLSHGEPTEVDTKTWEEMNPNTISEDDIERAKFLELRFGETALGKYWIKHIPESKKQVVVRWHDEETGLPMQVRLDNWYPDKYVCDLKSTGKSYTKFSDSAHTYGYHFQDAIYSDGLTLATGNRVPFFFAVGETAELKRARIVSLHPTQVEFARTKYHEALRNIAAENYTAYDFDRTEPEECELPAYLLYQYESEN